MKALILVTIEHYMWETVEAVSMSEDKLATFEREYKWIPLVSVEESEKLKRGKGSGLDHYVIRGITYLA